MTVEQQSVTEDKHTSKRTHISEVRKKAVLSRWESVQKEREQWLEPFYKLPIEQAMRYLEDLRDVCESAGGIMNQRINADNPRNMRCAGPRCGKDLSGTLANGRPKYMAKADFKDKKHPEIWHSLYWCSEVCKNGWLRQQGPDGGALGTTGA